MISFLLIDISFFYIIEGYLRDLGLECCINSFKDKRYEGIFN